MMFLPKNFHVFVHECMHGVCVGSGVGGEGVRRRKRGGVKFFQKLVVRAWS